MTRPSEAILRVPIVAIMIMQVAALFLRALVEVRLIENGEPEPFAQDLSYLVVPPVLIILMYPILRRHWAYLRSILQWQDLTPRLVIFSVLLGIIFRMTFWGALISLMYFGVLRNAESNAIVGPVISFECPDPGVLALSFLIVSFLTPVSEEVINRGLILPSLLHRGKVVAVVMSSLLFAVIHDPQAIILSFMVGLFLAVQTINYKTLWAPLITHATYNGMTILDWECVSAKWNPLETSSAMTGIGMIATALAVLGLSLSLLLILKKDIGAKKSPDVFID